MGKGYRVIQRLRKEPLIGAVWALKQKPLQLKVAREEGAKVEPF